MRGSSGPLGFRQPNARFCRSCVDSLKSPSSTTSLGTPQVVLGWHFPKVFLNCRRDLSTFRETYRIRCLCGIGG
jgi:hypothetical protein